MKQLIYSLILIVTIGACSKNEPFLAEDDNLAITSATDCDLISLVSFELIYYYSDPFEIKNASIRSNELVFDVAYGGGCGEVDFSLLVSNSFMESFPVQTHAVLVLKDNDTCKRKVTREICFDLTELAELYKSSYQTSKGSISISIPGQSPVLYTF